MVVSLICQSLSFSYGDTPILRDISFKLESGSFTALLGCNGAGKTTLLECINGLKIPDKGQIRLGETNLLNCGQAEVARNVSLVPQEHSDIFPFKVLEVVVMGRTPYLGVFNSPGAEDYEMAYGALKSLNAEALAQRNFNRISGGERRLVLLARAMVQEAKIMLLDEPTNHLDYKNQFLLLDFIKKMARRTGTAIFASMHDPTMALHFADNTLLLKNTRLSGSGNATTVMNPENISCLYGIDTRLLATADNGPQVFVPAMLLTESQSTEDAKKQDAKVVLITGPVQSGKSSLATELVAELRKHHIPLAGFVARGLWENNQRSGFDIHTLHDDKIIPLARRKTKQEDTGNVTPFHFFKEGEIAGQLALSPEKYRRSRVVIVDEIGKLELLGRGWAKWLSPLLSHKDLQVVLVVRDYLVEQVLQHWEIKNHILIQANRPSAIQELLSICTEHPVTPTAGTEEQSEQFKVKGNRS